MDIGLIKSETKLKPTEKQRIILFLITFKNRISLTNSYDYLKLEKFEA